VRGEENRFLNVVRHKDDGFAARLPDAQHFQIHLLARERIQRAERRGENRFHNALPR
jgi:hypothetical protein